MLASADADVDVPCAQVSVFLRLLEYHSGVLILTTNRIRTVDPAFLSRFSLAITYPDLSAEKRRQIWTTFLERAGARIKERPKKANGALPPTPARSGASTPVESVIRAKYLDRLAAKTFNGRCALSFALPDFDHSKLIIPFTQLHQEYCADGLGTRRVQGASSRGRAPRCSRQGLRNIPGRRQGAGRGCCLCVGLSRAHLNQH